MYCVRERKHDEINGLQVRLRSALINDSQGFIFNSA